VSKVHLEVTMMKIIGELKAENARLKDEVERLTAFTTRTIIPNEELQAQVEQMLITEKYQIERVISLEDCIQVLKQDRDGLLYEESEQVKRLKAEVERLEGDNQQLQARCNFLEDKPSYE